MLISKTSKYKRLYGMTQIQLAVHLNKTVAEVNVLHKRGLIKRLSNHLPENVSRKFINCFNSARTRCTIHSKRNTKSYINKGIKFELSHEDMFDLWIKYKADRMITPSLHRVDNSSGYTKDNCIIIEWEDHRKIHSMNRPSGYKIKNRKTIPRNENLECIKCKNTWHGKNLLLLECPKCNLIFRNNNII